MSCTVDTNIQFLSGMGPRRSALFKKELGIENIGDLLSHYPFRYIDRSRFYAIQETHPGLGYVQIRGHFTSMILQGEGKKSRLSAIFTDGIDRIDIVFFQGIRWIQKSIRLNTEYILFGKVSLFNQSLNMVHPEIEPVEGNTPSGYASMQALYGTTQALKNNGINQKIFSRLISEALSKVSDGLLDSLPLYLLERLHLPSKSEALKNIHFPLNNRTLLQAQNRLKFEELFYIQLGLLKQKSLRLTSLQGSTLVKIGPHFYNVYNNLPFSLTNAQKRVLKEIRNDVVSGKQMNRLLQGDVGSGKTLVALFSVMYAIDNGFQACMMAPTEILARQHYASIKKIIANGPTTIGLITGSTKSKDRKELVKKLKEGSLHLLIGTHALIEDTVQFDNLGFVVIDEQHRFGVAQRSRLWEKNKLQPHILVMTATPIPRTLSMTLYGDLDVSVIDELPPGRQPIKSLHFTDSQRLRVYSFMKKQIKAGHQVYVVFPLIKESEKMDYKNLEEGRQTIIQSFPAPDYLISVVHGQQKNTDKELFMNSFIKGKTNIMVATSVIEVGVDVPNASVMVIESAERFGLSQLHQLRGRVGRGAAQSYCIFLTGNKLTKEAQQRIELLCATNNGFEVAEADLRLRGPGDLEGTQQSGLAFDLKIANLAQDGQILELARKEALQILELDPHLEQPKNSVFIQELKHIHKNIIDYSRIS